MFELLITLVERVGIIVTIAFILTRFRFFRKMFYQDQLNRQQNLTILVVNAFMDKVMKEEERNCIHFLQASYC